MELMYEEERSQIIEAGNQLISNGLVALSGGNVSVRVASETVLVTPSGMAYDKMLPEDLVLVDISGGIVEGSRRPSVDTPALMHIYEHLPHVNAIIHTHQPYATAVGLVEDRLPAVVTTLPNATLGDVPVAPYASASSLQMGVVVADNLNGRRAVILRSHGVVTVGEDLKSALYAAVYLEEAAKSYIAARSLGTPIELTSDQVNESIEVFSTYGQPTAGPKEGDSK